MAVIMSMEEWDRKRKNKSVSVGSAALTSSVKDSSATESKRRVLPSLETWESSQSYDTSLKGFAKQADTTVRAIQKYYSEYHDDEDKWYESYDKSLSTLLSSADRYRREYADDADVVTSIDEIADTLTKTKTYIKEANKRNKQWKGTESYTKTMNRLAEADKINTLYGMSTQEIEAARLEAQGISTEELETLQAKKNSLEQKANAYSFSRGVTLEQKKAVQNELAQVNNAIQSAEQKSAIAYTTMDGQNITWDALYRRKQKEEDYAEFSKRDDWAENSTYKSTVPDENANYNDFSQPTVDWDYEEMNNPEAFSHLRGGSTYRSEHMTKEEMEMFNYIYHTQGRDAAFDWQRSLAEDLETLRVQDITAKTKEFASKSPLHGAAAWVGARLTSPLAGAEYVGDLVDNLFVPEKSMRNTAAARNAAVDSAITEQVDWNIGKWDAFDFGYGTLASAVDSALASLLPGGEAVLGLSAAASATNAALDRGMDEKSAVKAGIAAGVAESVFEHLSIGQFKKLQMIDPKSPKDFILNTIKSMGVNASEEAATEIANSVYDIYVNGEFSDYETNVRMMVQSGMTPEEARAEAKKTLGKQIAEAAASGALMGFGFGAAGSAIGYNSGLKQTGKEARSADGFNLKGLANESLQLDPNNKLAQKVLDKGRATDRQIGKLVRANEDARHAADVEKTRQTVTARLTALKATENVEAVADAVTKYVTGEKLTKAEQELIRRNRVAPQVAQEILEQKRAEEYMRIVEAAQIETEGTAERGSIEKTGDFLNEAAETATIAESATVEAADVNERKTLLRAGDAFEEVELDETHPISAINNGKMVLRLADGRNVAAEDISHVSEDISNVYSVVESLAADAQTANAMASGYKANMKSDSYIMGLQLSHMYGKNNISMKELVDGSPSAAKLPAKVREAAYRSGQAANNAAVSAAQQEKSKGAVKGVIGKGSVQFTTGNGNTEDIRGYIKRSGIKLNRQQQAGIVEMEMMAEAVGANFFVYASYVKGDGGRYYIDEHGKESKAPNGKYYKDGRIYIDLNAGSAGKGTMLYTTGHELGHHIKEWAPEKFDALANFLVEKYGEKGVSVESLVARQIEKAERSNRNIDFDEALEEVVADAMESILVDGKVMQMVADLQQQDKALGDKVREWFKNLLAKLKAIASAYKKFTPDSLEGQLVTEMDKSVIQQLQQIYAEGLVEAGENLSAARIGVEIDNETESVSPAVAMMSERTWTESDYVQQREEAAKEISKAIGVSEKKAKDYIDSVNSIAKMIAEDRVRLDYFSSPGRSSFVSNVEYGGSFDFSTLCKKRRLLTGTFTAIQKALPNTALTANEILDIRNRMKDAGLEVSCGLCYVEGSRANMGQFAKEFLKLYKQYYPDAWQPNMADVNTPDGIEWVRINHPECYEQYEYFWNHYGTLKVGDKNLFASQQKPKLYQLHTEYKGEILSKFNDDENVEEKNLNGGIRLQSFSDFEIVHLIDTMQIIMDMSRVGLAGQAYTKVPDFAWALGDTGLKINLSLIAKGVDGNGNLIFDDVEGMPIADAMKLRDRYSENVGTILVAFNDEQLKAAMADERVDFIIPFHRSQWKKSQYGAMGLPAKTKDYTYMQNEKFIKPQYHEYRGRMVKDKATNYMPNEYWDFSKSGKENAEAYLEMCARNNKRPKFYKLLQNNGDGSYSLKADGSTDGYWKLLIDFKMYDNAGNGSPQRAVRPDFNMVEAKRMLNDYTGGHSNFPVAQGIVDEFVSEYKGSHKGAKYSIRDDIVDVNGVKYKHVVELDYKNFNRVRRHAKAYIDFIRNNLINQKITVLNVNGDSEVIEFAREKEKVRKDGAKNEHPVIGELTQAKNETKKLVIMNAVETAEISRFSSNNSEHSHQWLDENGWEERTSFVMTREGIIYPVTLYIAKARDGRNILYDVNVKIKEGVAADKSATSLRAKGQARQAVGTTKPSAESVPQTGSEVKYSDRDSESVSNRALLANALESVAQNESEKQRLQEYRGVIDSLNEQEQKLQELNAEIKQLSFAEGKRDTARLENLRTEAKKTVNRINTLDGKLLRLEAAKPLQDVLKREKAKAYKRAEQKGKEALRKQREIFEEKIERMNQEQRENFKKARIAADIHYKRELSELRRKQEAKDAKRKESEAVKKYRSSVEKNAKSLMSMISHPTKDAHVPHSMMEPLKEFLDSISFISDRRYFDGEVTIRDIAYTRALNGVRRAVEGQVSAMNGSDFAGEYTLDINADFIKKIDEHIKEIEDATKKLDTGTNRVYAMNSAELKQLSEILRTINKAIRDIDKLHMQGAKARVSDLAADTKQELSRRKPVKTDDGGKAMWANYTPWHAFRRMGKSAQQIFKGLMQGQAKLAQNVNAVIEFTEKTYSAKEVKKWESDIHTVELSSGEKVKLTTAQLMSFYCLSQREHALDHLTGGGIRVVTIEDGLQKIRQPNKFLLSLEDITKLNELLMKNERAFAVAKELQKYMSTVGSDLINEISMARWDYMAATEKNYFPIKTDETSRDVKDPGQDATNLWALLNKSFTKGLTEGANNAIYVESIFDVFADHMSEASEYNAFALPLVDAMRWFNYRERNKLDGTQIKDSGVHDTIKTVLGSAAVDYFRNLMTDINSSQKAGRHENIAGQILSRSKISSVGYNLRVMIQQPTAILRASLILDPGSLLKGTARIRTKELVKEMQQYSGIALWKSMGYYDLNVSRSVKEQIKYDSSFIDKANNVGTWLPGKMDEVTWARIWAAAKAQVAKKQKLKGEALLKATAELFEEIVYQTQVADSVLTRSSLMRSKSQFMKEATSFMAEPTVSLNILLSAFQDYEEGHKTWDKVKRGVMIGFAGYAMSSIVNACITALADAWRDDDEYEEFHEKYLQALFGEKSFFDGNLFAELNPLGKIVFVKEVFSVLKGYGVMPGYADLFKSGYDLVTNYQKFIEGRGTITLYGLIYNTLQVVGTVGGIGLSNIAREVVGVWNHTVGMIYPEMKLVRYDIERKNQIRSALEGGSLSDEEAMELLVEEGVAENEDEAYFTVEKWRSEDPQHYSKYNDLFEAAKAGKSIDKALKVLTDHGVKEKDAISTLKSKIGKWYTGTKDVPPSINKQETINMLEKYTDMKESEITTQVNKWTAVVVTGIKYQDIEEKFISGEIKESRAIEMRMKYGGQTQKEAAAVVSKWKCEKDTGIPYDSLREEFVDGNITEKEAVNSMVKYGGIKQREAEETVTGWKAEKETGVAYSSIRESFLEGELTKSEAIDMYKNYGGMSQSEAEDAAAALQFEKDYGFSYSNKREAYIDGEISETTLRKALTEYGEKSAEDAENTIRAYDWMKQNPEYDLSENQAVAYTKPLEEYGGYSVADTGLDPDTFVSYKEQAGECEGVDSNGDGKADNGSKKKQILALIDSLPISNTQKDALYFASGNWTASKLYEAPWR